MLVIHSNYVIVIFGRALIEEMDHESFHDMHQMNVCVTTDLNLLLFFLFFYISNVDFISIARILHKLSLL